MAEWAGAWLLSPFYIQENWASEKSRNLSYVMMTYKPKHIGRACIQVPSAALSIKLPEDLTGSSFLAKLKIPSNSWNSLCKHSWLGLSLLDHSMSRPKPLISQSIWVVPHPLPPPSSASSCVGKECDKSAPTEAFSLELKRVGSLLRSVTSQW